MNLSMLTPEELLNYIDPVTEAEKALHRALSEAIYETLEEVKTNNVLLEQKVEALEIDLEQLKDKAEEKLKEANTLLDLAYDALENSFDHVSLLARIIQFECKL